LRTLHRGNVYQDFVQHTSRFVMLAGTDYSSKVASCWATNAFIFRGVGRGWDPVSCFQLSPQRIKTYL